MSPFPCCLSPFFSRRSRSCFARVFRSFLQDTSNRRRSEMKSDRPWFEIDGPSSLKLPIGRARFPTCIFPAVCTCCRNNRSPLFPLPSRVAKEKLLTVLCLLDFPSRFSCFSFPQFLSRFCFPLLIHVKRIYKLGETKWKQSGCQTCWEKFLFDAMLIAERERD